jgi:hypothetical protein
VLHKTIFATLAILTFFGLYLFGYLIFTLLAWVIIALANLTFGLNLEINIWAAGGLLFALHILVKLFLGKSKE